MREPAYIKVRDVKKNSNTVVVMPTFNQYEDTKYTIELLKRQSINFDIIIVDNASTDNTFDKLSKDFDDIVILLAEENYGGAGGFYIGQKYAYEKEYEYIILNDNDAMPIDDDLIESIVKEADEKHIVDCINIAEEDRPSLKIFHYGIYNKKIIDKIGFVKYSFFIYGDDVEYDLRMQKFGIKRKKVEKRYSHPMKYHYASNRVYFEIRNELENMKNYPIRRENLFNYFFTKLFYFSLYEKNKYAIMKKAIDDWKNNIWDNSFIKERIESDIKYQTINIRDIKKNNDLIVTFNKRFVELLDKNDVKYCLYSRNYFFGKKNQTLWTNNYIKAIAFHKKIYYFVDIKENGDIVYFEINNKSFLEKFSAFIKSTLNIFKIYLLILRN